MSVYKEDEYLLSNITEKQHGISIPGSYESLEGFIKSAGHIDKYKRYEIEDEAPIRTLRAFCNENKKYAKIEKNASTWTFEYEMLEMEEEGRKIGSKAVIIFRKHPGGLETVSVNLVSLNTGKSYRFH